MASCGFTASIQSTCDDFIKTGGAKKRFWVGKIEDLDRTQGEGGYDLDVDGNIEALYFVSYAGLYVFETKKNTTFGGFEMVKGEGPNVFNHMFTTKIFKENATAYGTLKDLSVSEVFIIEETNSGLFKAFGIDSGLEVQTMTQSDGANQQADSSIPLTFQGADDDLPRFVLDTNYATTLALLESYELSA